MQKAIAFIKKEPMLLVSVLAAAISLFITPPSASLLSSIDWRTLATLFMLLSVLEGFKTHDIFAPVIRLTARIKSVRRLTVFFFFRCFSPRCSSRTTSRS
ncbi:MAG: hypothetical protein IJ717_11575 [Treponema sp.]|nr:hypothetical protein [Treponema sp.]